MVTGDVPVNKKSHCPTVLEGDTGVLLRQVFVQLLSSRAVNHNKMSVVGL